jgi:quercetin dioxygenase-like cupin family protein
VIVNTKRRDHPVAENRGVAMSTTTEPATSTRTPQRTWLALGAVVTELARGEGGGLVVAEGTLPEGASPPLHVHDDLDDSFYLLDGRMVLRCGDDVWLAGPGEWVPFPRGVPHTFRVIDGTARVLMVHANDSFIGLVRDLGRPVDATRLPELAGGPNPEALRHAMAEHDISTVGPCMEEDEARAFLAALADR